MIPSGNVTKNFHWEELTRSGVASTRGIKEQFNPPKEVIENLTKLCEKVLQPLRDFTKFPIKVTSGYRCEEVNKAIGGARNSQHLTGQAADLQAVAGHSNWELFEALKQSDIIFDQCIVELINKDGEPSWIHISYSDKPRYEFLEAIKIKGVIKYRKIY